MEIAKLAPQTYFTGNSILPLFPFNEIIKFIKYGKNHIVIVTKNNKIFIYNSNKNWQINIGDYNNNKNILFVECGENFTIIVNELNEIYVSNSFKNISDSSLHKFTKIIDLKILENINFIKCSKNFFTIVTKNNFIYSYGSTDIFEDYNNCESQQFNFCNIVNNLQIKDLQCGINHIILLNNVGDIYGIGCNVNGQLGLGNLQKVNDFTKINLNFKVKKIICNNYDSSFLINDFNELFVCGLNNDGQLGLKEKLINTFTKIVIYNNNIKCLNIYKTFSDYNLISSFNNEMYICGNKLNTQLDVSNILTENFTKINSVEINKEFIYPLLLENEIFIVKSDYKINVIENEMYHYHLGLNCFKKLVEKKLLDILIQVNDF